jgi:hypothetical protein
MHLSTEQIHEAVRNPDWQKFRLSLKGLATEAKLNKLQEYLNEVNIETTGPGFGWLFRLIRVQNYLNALSRGGQIEPCDLDRSVIVQVKEAKIRR